MPTDQENAPSRAEPTPAGHLGPRKLSLRGAPVTVAFVCVIVALELVMTLSEMTGWPAGWVANRFAAQPLDFRESVLTDWAPIFWGASLQSELYSLPATAFLHGSVLHVGFNAALIAALGPPIERAVGPALYALTVVLLSIATPLGHWAMLALEGAQSGWSVLVGASGVVCGLIAIDVAARAFTIRRLPAFVRAQLPDPMALVLRVSLVMILVNVAIELLSASIGGAQISGAGHISGYLAGLALAPLLLFVQARPRAPL